MKKKKTAIDLFAESRITVFLQSTFITLGSTALIGVGAYYLDHYLGTFPVLFIIGLVLAYPITQIYLFRKFKRFGAEKLKEIKK